MMDLNKVERDLDRLTDNGDWFYDTTSKMIESGSQVIGHAGNIDDGIIISKMPATIRKLVQNVRFLEKELKYSRDIKKI